MKRSIKKFTKRPLAGILAAGMIIGSLVPGSSAKAEWNLLDHCELPIAVVIIGSYVHATTVQTIVSQALVSQTGGGAVGAGLAPGPMNELWKGELEDVDGWLPGLGVTVGLPILNDAEISFKYQTGELEGDFKTWPLSSPSDVFRANADIDRDLWEVAFTYPLIDWFYGRVEYFHYNDEATLNYGGGEIEKQDYQWQGIRAGVGARQEIPLGETGATATLDAFAGLMYFDYEVHEKTAGVKTDFDGLGYVLRAGAGVSYPLGEIFSVVGGASYEYMTTKDGPDLDNQSLNLTLGVSGIF